MRYLARPPEKTQKKDRRQTAADQRQRRACKEFAVNELSAPLEADPNQDKWIALAEALAQRFDAQYDRLYLRDAIARVLQDQGPTSLISEEIAAQFKKEAIFLEYRDLKDFQKKFPILLWNKSGSPFLLTARATRRRFLAMTVDSAGEIVEEYVTPAQLKKNWGAATAFEDAIPAEAWEQESVFKSGKNWFWGAIAPLFGTMRYLIMAAVFGNVLAIAASLFSMQVWDRVVPAQSLNSLAVLAAGVITASLFEMVLRMQRSALIDSVGKGVDLHISAGVFSHMLHMKADARPASLGSLAAQIREINQIRDAISSTMLSAAIDMPFVFIYCAVIYAIGGTLVYPILAVIPIILLAGLLAQFPLARLAKMGLEEASLRNALIVETVLKSDEVKLQEAESTMQLRWNRTIEHSNAISTKQRFWRDFLSNFTQILQQFGYVGVISLGAIMVINGQATMGQVIACSILTSRSIAPLTQVSAVLATLQGSIMAKRSIDAMMQRPADTPSTKHLRRDLSAPILEMRNLTYKYPNTETITLDINNLKIGYGERVGIVGRIGSGKSTILRAMSGLAEPSAGTILLDNTEISIIHPVDLRRAIGYQSQGSALFRGTIRENLAIARPSARDGEMIAACEVSGVLDLIKNSPRGLDLQINEAGQGLSGGQKQSLLLARAILRNPKILLLDEPTAAMDEQTEAKFTSDLKTWAADRTVIIATHRMRPLSICDRLLVIEHGRIVMDGPKDEVIAKLSGKVGS